MSVRVRSPPPHGIPRGRRPSGAHQLALRPARGVFVLRIRGHGRADPPEMTRAILDGLSWLGIAWDEGPFFQSGRQALYTENWKLLESGHAYRCFCSKEALEGGATPPASPADGSMTSSAEPSPGTNRIFAPRPWNPSWSVAPSPRASWAGTTW